MRTISRLFVCAGILLLAACQQTIRSDVSRFHKMPPPAGEAVYVVPKDPAKQGSLEFAQYAALVREKMVALGYKAVPSEADAQLIVKMDYKISQPSQKVETRPGFGPGPYPYRYYRFHAGYYDPYWMGSAFDYPEVYSTTVYARYLELDIVRAGENGEALFNGRAESIGTNNSLPEVMPYLVQAMFTNFPGESGVTKRVIIDLPR